MAYRFALSPPPARVSVLAVSFGLDAAVFATRPPTFVEDRLEAYSTRIRPTDLCHPTYLSNLHPRSWLSSCLSLVGGLARRAQRIEGHDVSRRRCPLPPDPTIGARVFAEAVRRIELLTPLSPARVGAPPSQTTASSRSSRDRRRLASVKRRDEGTIRGAFLR